MTYYLLFQENEMRLIPVKAGLDDSFTQRYARLILASGENPLEVLRKFDELPLVFCEDWIPRFAVPA